jgi:hypothetical protein
MTQPRRSISSQLSERGRRILAAAIVVTVAACASEVIPDTATMPFGALNTNGDIDLRSLDIAAYDFAHPIKGDPAQAAEAIAAVDYMGGQVEHLATLGHHAVYLPRPDAPIARSSATVRRHQPGGTIPGGGGHDVGGCSSLSGAGSECGAAAARRADPHRTSKRSGGSSQRRSLDNGGHRRDARGRCSRIRVLLPHEDHEIARTCPSADVKPEHRSFSHREDRTMLRLNRPGFVEGCLV